MKKIYLLLSVYLLIGFNYIYADNVNLKSYIVNDNWAKLGIPTFDATKMPVSPIICVNNSNVTLGNTPQATINFDQTTSSSVISRSLNLGLGVSGIQVYGIKGFNVAFSNAITNTDYAYNFTYLYIYSTQATINSTTYGDSNLSMSGKNALNAGAEAFFASCGDSYINSLDAGVVLAVNINVRFQTKQQAREFGAKISLGNSLVNIIPSIGLAESKLLASSIISISALQNGGTASELNRIFGINPETGKYTVSECRLNDTNSCTATVNSIINYAATLRQQIESQGNLIESRLYYFNPVLVSYASIGIPVSRPKLLSTAAINAQNSIFEEVNLTNNRIEFLKSYASMPIPLKPDLKSYINQQLKTLNSRLEYIKNTAVGCFSSDAEQCPLILEQIRNTLKSSPISYGFDEKKYNILQDAWYYTYDTNFGYLLPVSLNNIYVIYKAPPYKAKKIAVAYSKIESGQTYINRIDLDSGFISAFGNPYTCLPSALDNKFSDIRNFVCKNFLSPNFRVQITKINNPI